MNSNEVPSGLALWVLAARPKTLWAAVAPVLIGTAMAYESGGGAWLPALAALFAAIMIQVGTNFSNDYFDYKKGTDDHDRIGPMRMTQAGLVTPDAMKRATVLAFLLACAAGAYLVWRAGWPIAIIGLVSVLCGLLYTAGPYPLGYIGLADLFVLVFFGPVAVGGTYFVQTLTIGGNVLFAGLAPGLFSVAILTVNNLRDIDGDRAAGKRTLAVRFGRPFARLEYLCSIVAASVVPLLLYVSSQTHPYSLFAVLVSLAAWPAIQKVFTIIDGPVLNEVLASTGKLLLLYSLIFSIGWLL
jgi:1,4-dihydroxy-2-naphthoate octaprenyltransferase